MSNRSVCPIFTYINRIKLCNVCTAHDGHHDIDDELNYPVVYI